MPFLSRQQINPKVLDRHIDQQRERLRQALMEPTLTADQRSAVKALLEGLNLVKGPKVYRIDSPPKPWAIQIPMSEG